MNERILLVDYENIIRRSATHPSLALGAALRAFSDASRRSQAGSDLWYVTRAHCLRQDVATDEVRKASRARAPDSPMSAEHKDVLLEKEKVLPRKRTGLEGKVKSWFQDLSAADRDELVAQLFEDGFVKESEKKELTFFRVRLRGK